jgi:hypothetical protein
MLLISLLNSYFCCFKTEKLERITKEIIVEFISKNEIELASTHTRLSLPIINRIFKKMSSNIKIPAIKVEGDFTCDGHH